MNDHETGFLELLTERTRRRMHALLEADPRRRQEALEYLNHVEFDARWRAPLTGSTSSPGSILKALTKHGAPANCYVLSREPELDGITLPLEDAILAVSGLLEGTFISCVAGKLGFFEGPGIKSAYLIFKRS